MSTVDGLRPLRRRDRDLAPYSALATASTRLRPGKPSAPSTSRTIASVRRFATASD